MGQRLTAASMPGSSQWATMARALASAPPGPTLHRILLCLEKDRKKESGGGQRAGDRTWGRNKGDQPGRGAPGGVQPSACPQALQLSCWPGGSGRPGLKALVASHYVHGPQSTAPRTAEGAGPLMAVLMAALTVVVSTKDLALTAVPPLHPITASE